MVTICIKGAVERGDRSYFTFRSFKNYDRDMFVSDLSEILDNDRGLNHDLLFAYAWML